VHVICVTRRRTVIAGQPWMPIQWRAFRSAKTPNLLEIAEERGGFDESVTSGDNREVVSRQKWACGAAGSALPWHGRGRRFDPDQVHQLILKNQLSGRSFVALRISPVGSDAHKTAQVRSRPGPPNIRRDINVIEFCLRIQIPFNPSSIPRSYFCVVVTLVDRCPSILRPGMARLSMLRCLLFAMPNGLVRYHHTEDSHFIPCRCFR
jgi:hypothetical protein